MSRDAPPCLHILLVTDRGLTSAWTSRGVAVGWCMFESTNPARARSGALAAARKVMRGR